MQGIWIPVRVGTASAVWDTSTSIASRRAGTTQTSCDRTVANRSCAADHSVLQSLVSLGLSNGWQDTVTTITSGEHVFVRDPQAMCGINSRKTDRRKIHISHQVVGHAKIRHAGHISFQGMHACSKQSRRVNAVTASNCETRQDSPRSWMVPPI